MLFLNILFKKISERGFLFIKLHLYTSIFFGILYWCCDYILFLYPKLAEKLHLGKNNNRVDNISYWLWFSLVTQTTVGYLGATGDLNNSISFDKLNYNLVKVINIIQLCCIIVISSLIL